MSARFGHVVVTGSTGFIGSHLARRLIDENVRVTGLSRRTGYDVLRHDLPLADVDHVYHAAGLTYVPDSWSQPLAFYEINAAGTMRVLEQCRRAGVPLTYISGYVYGVPASLPISEAMQPRPGNPYAFSKLAGEDACRFFADVLGLPVRILRLFNVYGPGQDATFLIPTIARQVLNAAVAEIVVADLEPRRDFVHIADVVDALLCAPELPPGRPFNVGSGRSWSVRDVITACLDAAGVSKPYRSRGERRANEVLDVVADISAIRAACGWSPKVDFTRGITSVIESLQPC